MRLKQFSLIKCTYCLLSLMGMLTLVGCPNFFAIENLLDVSNLYSNKYNQQLNGISENGTFATGSQSDDDGVDATLLKLGRDGKPTQITELIRPEGFSSCAGSDVSDFGQVCGQCTDISCAAEEHQYHT